MNNMQGTTAALESATPNQPCPYFAWCTKTGAEHDDDFHTGSTVDKWSASTGEVAVYLEAHIPEDGSATPPQVNIDGPLGDGSKDLAELTIGDARRLGRALLAATDAADDRNDPVGTENPECAHAWCEYGGDGHRDHESAGMYVAATGGRGPHTVDLDGARFPALRVFLSAEAARDATVGLFIGGLPDKGEEEVQLTVAEARQLRDALDVMLRHVVPSEEFEHRTIARSPAAVR